MHWLILHCACGLAPSTAIRRLQEGAAWGTAATEMLILMEKEPPFQSFAFISYSCYMFPVRLS